MVRLLTKDDFSDIYFKFKQKGVNFLLGKLHFSGRSRTRNTFSYDGVTVAEWYVVPAVKQRWNRLITGDSDIIYEDFLLQQIFIDRTGMSLLSLGSGGCNHELKLASGSVFSEITCVDIAQGQLDVAAEKAKSQDGSKMRFVCADARTFLKQQKAKFDVVLFNASLHHFDHVDDLIKNQIYPILFPGGYLIINEYVGPNRLQFPAVQLAAINDALQLAPKQFRTIYGTSVVKNRFCGFGLLRMLLADPSECVDSAAILPAIHATFQTVVERPFGGNILMGALKNIAHHFVSDDSETQSVLKAMSDAEDQYIAENPSDFMFGVYQKAR
ncbi:MAG: class I SAM-dependent methyltransferase [Dysgonamonadaceae bacterium]|jgi:ubiquinone/menaquinone biosynthesis C-methylase UbiE|nr:class I SAM-dependent methyltransferase [Dysgonamonadaceae bacterium]